MPIGTPPKKPDMPLPKATADFGRASLKVAASAVRSFLMRARLTPPWLFADGFMVLPRRFPFLAVGAFPRNRARFIDFSRPSQKVPLSVSPLRQA
jgi:hypothetical protein